MKRRNFLWYSLLFITSCSAIKTQSKSSVSLPAKLNFAITDAIGLEQLEKEYEAFRVALEEVLETSVEFFPVENFFMTASALQSGQVDLAWAGPSEYVTIHARTNAAPLVSLVRTDYLTIMVARADSGIKSLTDLKGKTVDIWKNGSTAGHLGAFKLLMDAGLDPQEDIEILIPERNKVGTLQNGKVFTEDATFKTLNSGEADVWCRSAHRYQPALDYEGASADDYPIIAKGPTLPGDIFVLSSQLDPNIVKEIQSLMFANKDKLIKAIHSVESLASSFKYAEFTIAQNSDYDMIREVYKAIGQDDFL
ncbi:MAG: PhnD/SsuA/transferrin family substrate-binding protein [Okeania sp. SIO2D1]|nr:PhnD/SsuA/transferrin family substrate-binding protein [Okeania sp. SIO2D1]